MRAPPLPPCPRAVGTPTGRSLFCAFSPMRLLSWPRTKKLESQEGRAGHVRSGPLMVSPLVGAASASEPQAIWDPKAGGRFRSAYAASGLPVCGPTIAKTRLSVARLKSPFSLALRRWSGASDWSSTTQPSRAVTHSQPWSPSKTRRERWCDVLNLHPAVATSVLCVFPHAQPMSSLGTFGIQALHGPARKIAHRSSRL
jgi:hypothetical protein